MAEERQGGEAYVQARFHVWIVMVGISPAGVLCAEWCLSGFVAEWHFAGVALCCMEENAFNNTSSITFFFFPSIRKGWGLGKGEEEDGGLGLVVGSTHMHTHHFCSDSKNCK